MVDYRRLVVAMGLVCLLGWAGSERVQAASTYDWCVNSCGSGASCDMECEADGGGTTTCGQYDGGSANDWCDGDTCEDICGPYSDPSYECYHEGDPTDCYTYGDTAVCNDGYCAVNSVEDCGNCPGDCGPCPDIECGDETCDFDYGETYRNCPQDCPEPIEVGYCGDLNCKPDEGPECPECRTPNEFCGWDYNCPMGWDCVGNQCVHSQYIGSLVDCTGGGQAQCDTAFPNDVYWCRATHNLMTGGSLSVCVPWYWDIH